MNIFVVYMIEDFSVGGRDISAADARQLQDELDTGKHHPDCWAAFHETETGKALEPIYGDVGTPDTQDYCIGFEYVQEEALEA